MIKKKSETFSLSLLNSNIFPCFAAYSKDKDKEKKLDDESNSPTVPQSAFLGPTLWDKTLPYDGDTFQLEYMDLEEFLSENGIPPARLSMTTAPTLLGCSRPPQRPLPSWTSAVGPPHPFTLAYHPRTVCRAPCDQVKSQRVLPSPGDEGSEGGGRD